MRGYVISGQAASLQPYTSGRAGVRGDFATLRPYAAKHADVARLLAIERVQAASLERFFDSEVALVRSGSQGRALAASRLLDGKVLFDAFRLTARRTDDVAVSIVADARAAQERTFRNMLMLLLALGGGSIVLSVVIARVLLRLVGSTATRLEHSAADLEERAAELERSTASCRSSPTWLPMICRSRCGRSRALRSFSAVAIAAGSIAMPTSSSRSSSTAPSECSA